jgi:hypothetical protein
MIEAKAYHGQHRITGEGVDLTKQQHSPHVVLG